MECLIQYLDDLEDLFYAVALVAERIRSILKLLLLSVLGILIPVGGVFLALADPPLARAAVFMTLSGLLYRAATGNFSRHAGV
jgi:hypothetical protein